MSPAFSSHNFLDHRFRYAEFVGNESRAVMSSKRHGYDLIHNGSCEFGGLSIPKRSPSLGPHIPNVVRLTAKPQVGGVYAKRIVSIRAIMQNMKPFWNWANHNDPRCSMSTYAPAFFGRRKRRTPKYFSIAIRTFATSPNPTRVSLDHPPPKSFWKVIGKVLRSQIFRSNLHHWFNICPIALLARRAFLLSPNSTFQSRVQ